MKNKYTFIADEKSYVLEVEDESPGQIFDYTAYEKSLEKTLDQAQKDFWSQYIDINRHQLVVGKNNLWVAVALIGALSSIYIELHEVVDLFSVTGSIYCISFLLAITGFSLCLYALPARSGYELPYQNWSELSMNAYNRLSKKEKNAYSEFLSDFITDIDTANHKNLKTNGTRAYLFRIVSWLLVCSLAFLLLSALVFLANVNNQWPCDLVAINLGKYMECIK